MHVSAVKKSLPVFCMFTSCTLDPLSWPSIPETQVQPLCLALYEKRRGLRGISIARWGGLKMVLGEDKIYWIFYFFRERHGLGRVAHVAYPHRGLLRDRRPHLVPLPLNDGESLGEGPHLRGPRDILPVESKSSTKKFAEVSVQEAEKETEINATQEQEQ